MINKKSLPIITNRLFVVFLHTIKFLMGQYCVKLVKIKKRKHLLRDYLWGLVFRDGLRGKGILS